MSTDFRLLGSVEVVERDRPLALGGVKQRSLLAILLLHANEVVSTERLIDELWGHAPPVTVAKSIQTYVSRLRRQLGDGRLLTRAPGYLLRVAPDELDVARFERLVADAGDSDPARAAVTLREALALWRGPALADLASERFAQPAIERLEELRMGAVERRIDADLAGGRHAELIGELAALVREHPLRERLHAQLMLALYRCGRQAEALEAFRSARNVFVGEVGIEPSHRLRQLHQAILEQAPSLDPAAVEDAPPETSGKVFVGRRHELAALLAGLEDAFAGRGRLFLIEGEPGIGKSRLAEEVGARAFDRGARVLVGRCWEQGGAPAYWPWTQALRGYVRTADASLLRAELGADAGELTTLMPELRERFADLPEPSRLDPDGARFRLFDATVEFLRSASERRPLVLVLDDLHAADVPSLLLLQFVARALGATRIMVVGAYRNVDPLPRARLTETLAELAREPVTRRLSLAGLSASEIAEYVEVTAARLASHRLTTSLHVRTQGNPLFVGEIVRLLAVEGGDESVTPQSIRDVIARRLAHLSPETNRLLTLAMSWSSSSTKRSSRASSPVLRVLGIASGLSMC
jgi:DNA-binding SARP family transcriptional activator